MPNSTVLELQDVEVVVLVYSAQRAQRMLSQLSTKQSQVMEALGLTRFAPPPPATPAS